MAELSTRGKFGPVQWAITGLGGGAGLALGIAAIKTIEARPEFLPQLLSGGFLYMAALIVGMVMFRSQLSEFNATQLRSVTAQEKLAENVGALVLKDDTRTQALEAAMRYVAEESRQTSERTQEMMNLLRSPQNTRGERGENRS